MAQPLRVLIALAEDLGLIPEPYSDSKHSLTPVPGDPIPGFCSLQAPGTRDTNTYMQAKHTHR